MKSLPLQIVDLFENTIWSVYTSKVAAWRKGSGKMSWKSRRGYLRTLRNDDDGTPNATFSSFGTPAHERLFDGSSYLSFYHHPHEFHFAFKKGSTSLFSGSLRLTLE